MDATRTKPTVFVSSTCLDLKQIREDDILHFLYYPYYSISIFLIQVELVFLKFVSIINISS